MCCIVYQKNMSACPVFGKPLRETSVVPIAHNGREGKQLLKNQLVLVTV